MRAGKPNPGANEYHFQATLSSLFSASLPLIYLGSFLHFPVGTCRSLKGCEAHKFLMDSILKHSVGVCVWALWEGCTLYKKEREVNSQGKDAWLWWEPVNGVTREVSIWLEAQQDLPSSSSSSLREAIFLWPDPEHPCQQEEKLPVTRWFHWSLTQLEASRIITLQDNQSRNGTPHSGWVLFCQLLTKKNAL